MAHVLGILADSHGDAEITARAIRLLEEHGADEIIHLGDVGCEAVIDELVGHNARIVFGNCDLDVRSLTNYCEEIDITVDHPIGWLEVDGKTIAFTHGDLDIAMREAMRRRVDYLLHGHSHTLRDDQIGSTRIINPGALFRAARYTAALLEPGSGQLRILEVPRPEPVNGRLRSSNGSPR